MEQKGIFDETDNEFSKTRQIEASFPKTKREKKISERFANYIIRGYVITRIFFQITTSPNKGKNRENEVSFLETVNSQVISERFANYTIRR